MQVCNAPTLTDCHWRRVWGEIKGEDGGGSYVLNVRLVCLVALIPKHAAVLSLASSSRSALLLPSVAFVDLAAPLFSISLSLPGCTYYEKGER